MTWECWKDIKEYELHKFVSIVSDMAKAWLENRKSEEYNFYCLGINIQNMLSGEKVKALTYKEYINKSLNIESSKDNKESDTTRKEKADKAVAKLKEKFLKGMR